MSRRSRAAVARSAGGDRTLTTVLGLVLVAASVLALLVGFGVFGSFRAQRPVIDPLIVEWVSTHATAALVYAYPKATCSARAGGASQPASFAEA